MSTRKKSGLEKVHPEKVRSGKKKARPEKVRSGKVRPEKVRPEKAHLEKVHPKHSWNILGTLLELLELTKEKTSFHASFNHKNIPGTFQL